MDKEKLREQFEEMRIKCWTKTIYTDSPDINSILRNRDLPPGKRILRVDDEMHEIDVNAPNVEESEFCPFNTCPVGSIAVEEACLEDAETMKPVNKEKIITEEHYRTENGSPVPIARIVGDEAVDYLGRPVVVKKQIKTIVASCPEGWIMGERTDAINWLGGKKPLLTAGIAHEEEGGLGVDVKEVSASEGAELEVDTTAVCVKIQPMPMEKKWVEMITDSIIGWGGYAEFPFWDVPWGVMNSIAEHRSRWTGNYMAHAAEIEEGYRVCWNDYNEYPCACFKDREEAKNFDDARKYYDWSNQFQKDAEDTLKEEGAEPTEQAINDRMQSDREFFFEDIGMQFPSYMGIGERTFRDSPVQYTSKWEKGKSRELIVLVKEDL